MIDGGIISEARREDDVLFIRSQLDCLVAHHIGKLHTFLIVLVRLAEFRVKGVVFSVVSETEKVDIGKMIVISVFFGIFQETRRRCEINVP